MEHSGIIPVGAITDPDLQDVATRPGPVATVVLALDPAVDHAAQRDTTRWRSVREQLVALGATAPALDAIEELVPDAHLGGAAWLVVAGDDGVRLVEHSARPPRRDLVRWSSMPDLAPFVERRQSEIPHLVVVVDHEGADIVVDPGTGPVVRAGAGGADGPVARSASGGDRQKRNQRRVESTWKDNARDAATQISELATAVDARLIVVSGDPHSVSLLREALPPADLEMVEVLGGTASGGGAMDEAQQVHRLVATVAARDSVAFLGKWREQLGQRSRAVEGAGATLDALRQGAVEVLLVHDDVDDERQAWFGPDPAHAALTKQELESMGVDDQGTARLVDVAVRAALGTGASVRIVPAHGGPLDGLGALLRWASPA